MNFSLEDVKSIAPVDFITRRYTPVEDLNAGEKEVFLAELILCLEDLENAKPSWFDKFSSEVLVEFLELSHRYFAEHVLPGIERDLEVWTDHPECPKRVSDYGLYFFREFERGLFEHFKYEEEKLFPHALSPKGDFDFTDFESHHPHTTLDAGKLIILLSDKEEKVEKPMSYRILMEKLKTLDKELRLHEFIEENVLFDRCK